MEPYPSDALARISGDVVASPDAGRAMRAWRERLGIKQVALAHALRLSASVLSDYESGRRPSPGVQFVKKYVEALVKLDEGKERVVSKLVARGEEQAILSIGEFTAPLEATKILSALDATVLSGDPDQVKLYGYTVVDSIKTIYALSGYDFYRIFGATTERALVFTKVGMGRSPLVAIRVSQLKPRMVVIHGPREVDPLAIELAKKERLVLALSGVPTDEALIASLREVQEREAAPRRGP
ncbi:MAG: helix-turn-helix domain-containing protein [Nitrososphaerota archaeon]|jgi:putative transcriptional regulator|nr:helix-turn-helix domain-containing protein [Nitrososphaerota archaeon]